MNADLREYLGPFIQNRTNVLSLSTYSSFTSLHKIKQQQGYSAVKSRKCGNNILLTKENFKGEKLSMLNLINTKNMVHIAVLEEQEYVESWCVRMKRKNGLESNEWSQTKVSFTTPLKKWKDEIF